LVVEVVFRGNKELDGVLVGEGAWELSDIMADLLINSKHYGQVRLILFDEAMLPEKVDYESLWKRTGKPVLVICRNSEFNPRFMFKYHEITISATGIDEESARRVLRVVYGESESESLRIASIILESMSTLHNV
jgi:endonuclease V-like protein UPF0215 family